MKRYRIYSEFINDNNLKVIKEKTVKLLGFGTIYRNGITGVWSGSQERSFIIEYIGQPKEQYKIKKLAEFIKQYNSQESVLITSENIESELI
jgi:hypothetical protein